MQARALSVSALFVTVLAALPGALAAMPVVVEPEVPGEAVLAVHLVSRARDATDMPADAAPKRVRADVGVTLYAVLEVADGPHGARRFYSDAGRIRLDGRVHVALPMARAI